MTSEICDDFINLNINTTKYPFNKWIQWSPSNIIPFKCARSGIGPGEYKLSGEIDIKPKGQNSNYDCDIIINGTSHKAEIKNLDKHTFNTGVMGQRKIQHIKNKLRNLLVDCENICNISNNIFTENEKNKISKLININTDEISAKNVINIKSTLSLLNNKQQCLTKKLQKKDTYHPVTGKKTTINSLNLYNQLSCLNESVDNIVSVIGEQELLCIKLLICLNHDYVSDINLFEKELNDTTKMFDDLILIFVDENKGYYLSSKPHQKITFERITRGHPRFKIDIAEC